MDCAERFALRFNLFKLAQTFNLQRCGHSNRGPQDEGAEMKIQRPWCGFEIKSFPGINIFKKYQQPVNVLKLTRGILQKI